MSDPREPNDFAFSDMSDNPENTGWFGNNRDEDDLRLNFDDEEPLDENNWWDDDDLRWIGD